MESIHFQYPSWYLLLCLAAGVLFALALYWRDRSFEDQKGWVRIVMAALRGLTVAVICALLLAPFLKLFENSTQDPLIVIAHDNSQSIGAVTNGEDSIQYRQRLDVLHDALADRYNVVRLNFGEEIRETDTIDFSESLTDISQVLNYVSDQYTSENLGSVILASDGLYNHGRQPLYTNTAIKAPIHMIALGDTSTHADLKIANVFHNDIAYLGSKFPVQIDIAAENFDARQTTLTVTDANGNEVHRENFQIDSRDFFATTEFLIDAATPGVQRYTARLTGLSGEYSYANNARSMYIEVIDGRLTVLVLGDVPHPDLAGLRAAITTNENYSVDVFLFDEFDGDPTGYDLVILHNLPSDRNPINSLHTILEREDIPRIYMIGANTNIRNFNAIQDLLSIEGSSQSPNDVSAIVDQDFKLFTIPEDFGTQLGSFAPLSAPFGEYNVNPAASVYLFQKIGSVDTQFPLIMFGQQGETKVGIIAAEGFWKWRLFDFLQNDSHELTNTLVNKTVQYVTVKEDKRKFRVSPLKNLFTDIETIGFTAELYNESYELINDSDAFLEVRDSSGNVYDFTFSKQANSYSIDIGRFPIGEYTYRGFTDFGGVRLQANGRFSVKEIQLELYNTTADHSLLYQLADKYGGSVYYPDQLEALASAIRNDDSLKPVIYSSARNTPLLNIRWLFGILLFLLGFEWFLRRYFGGY